MNPKLKKTIWYLIGLSIILIPLINLILLEPGYILNWDMSGSFDYRAPFDQYFKLFTPYDGSTIGVRSRVPIVSIIWSITKLLSPLTAEPNYLPIKIATVLMFVGAYTAFFFTFPKISQFLRRKPQKSTNIAISVVTLTILSLLYTILPWYTSRIPQLHLFYASTVYPIQVLAFLQLFNSRSVNIKNILIFVIATFFGLSSPHMIIFLLITYIALGFPLIINVLKNKQLQILLINGLLALLLILVTNLYWIYPYFIQGMPSPGYVINTEMLELLRQSATPINFLLNQSDWFIEQSKLHTFGENIAVIALQVVGIASLYLLAIVGLLKKIKPNFTIAIVILCTTSLLIIVPLSDAHTEILNTLTFSSFGWIFREANKFYILWSFWIFIAFAIQISSLELKGFYNKGIRFFTLFGVLGLFLPLTLTYLGNLKPQTLPAELTQLNEKLEQEASKGFYAHYYPNQHIYTIGWEEPSFIIADETEYKFIPYNSPIPPTQISSVIPHKNSFESLYTNYLLENISEFKSITPYLKDMGIKYIIIRKTAIPLTISADYNQEKYINPVVQALSKDSEFSKKIDNKDFTLFVVNNFSNETKTYNQILKTYDGFDILKQISPETLDNSKLAFCTFEQFMDLCSDNKTQSIYISTNTTTHNLKIILENTDTTKVYPFDSIRDFSTNITWGRASMENAVNGEFSHITRVYGFNSWVFTNQDKIAYSSINKDSLQDTTNLSIPLPTNCSNNHCFAYLEYYSSPIGGELTYTLNNKKRVLSTVSQIPTLQLVEVEIEKGTDSIIISSPKGFNAITTIYFSQIQITAQENTLLPSDIKQNYDSNDSAIWIFIPDLQQNNILTISISNIFLVSAWIITFVAYLFIIIRKRK